MARPSKLTPEKEEQLRARWTAGVESVDSLCAEFKISKSTLYDMVKAKAWGPRDPAKVLTNEVRRRMSGVSGASSGNPETSGNSGNPGIDAVATELVDALKMAVETGKLTLLATREWAKLASVNNGFARKDLQANTAAATGALELIRKAGGLDAGEAAIGLESLSDEDLDAKIRAYGG